MTFRIRRLAEEDADAMLEAVLESVAEIAPWMVWCRPTYSRADAAAWIASTIAGHRDGSGFEFVFIDADGTLSGCCGVNHINHVDRFANIGYWTRTSRTGRGLAAQAVVAVASWAFANTGLNRLEIVAAVGNRRSQRVAEKIGAVREGVLRQRTIADGAAQDAVLYSIVRGDAISRPARSSPATQSRQP